MLLAVLLGEELELTLLRNVASGSEPLDGLETRLVRLSGHNATLVHHQVRLLETTRRVICIAVHHHLARTNSRLTSTAHHVIAASYRIVLAHIILARHHVVLAILATVLATYTSVGRGTVVHGGVHLVLPKQHIFFKKGGISAHRKRTLLNGTTDPVL